MHEGGHGCTHEKFNPFSRFRVSLELPLLELPSSSSEDGTSSGSGLGWAMRRTRRRHVEGSSMDGALGAPPADDGPLSFAHSTPERLFDILNASLRSSSQVEGAWGGCWDPSLGF